MPETTMGAATQIGGLEYKQFSDWFKKAYNQSVPANNAELLNHPQYLYWKQYIRPKVWSPEQETAYTQQLAKEGNVIPFGLPTPPPLVQPPKEEEKKYLYEGEEYTLGDLAALAPWFEFLERRRQFDISRQLREAEEQKKLEMQQLATKQEIARMRGFQMQQSLRSPWDYLGKSPNQGALDFETMREHLIESVRPESRNWISQYVKNVANPFAGQSQGRSDEDYAMLQDEAKRTKIAADRVRARLGDSNDSLTEPSLRGADPAENTEAGAALRILQAEKVVNDRLMKIETGRAEGILAAQTGGGVPSGESAAQAYWATPRATATGNYVVGREGGGVNQPSLTPEIPDWLQRASGLAGRVPEKRFASEIQRPSGQSWMRMTPTQQSQYAGLVDWAGTQSFEDIMAETARQLPQTPRVPRSWRAFSQV